MHPLLQEYLDLNSVNLVNLEDVPKEVLDSDCPYPELKACLHFAFHSQMETYQKRLQTLQQQLANIDRHVWQLEVQLCLFLLHLKTCMCYIKRNDTLMIFFAPTNMYHIGRTKGADINDRFKAQQVISVRSTVNSVCRSKQLCMTRPAHYEVD